LAPVFPSFSSMRWRVVDDVQCSCYYQTVPRVKSGLPVHGGPVGCATCVARQAPGKSWLSFEEIRFRVESEAGDALAETSCENLRALVVSNGFESRSSGNTRGYAGGSRRNGTPPNLVGVRRGVTVVGDLV